jgi:adenosylcobalamin-dependent ribonucleoside-triphosphate reductase
LSEIPWGPTGEVVYQRTYSRTKPDGTKETWPETIVRVVDGNLALVHGPDKNAWPVEALRERERLLFYMHRFAILPAGRHLWASGVKGRQYLFNCHVAGWGEKLSDHFEFSFLRLMEGGGVGANYSTKHIARYGFPRRNLKVHIVCDPGHADIDELRPLLSTEFHPDWEGAVVVADSREGWAAALMDLIDTFMTDDEVKHADRVYDATYVRPSGSRLKTFGGTASGPAPFARMMHEVARVLNIAWSVGHLTPLHVMEIDHAIAECVVSGGNRRSARMSIVHWDDDYIKDFIDCKKDTGKHWTTNISVEVDDEFFEQLAKPGSWAVAVHEAVTRAMLENGEPGYWNSSLSQEGEVGEVIATNPCGEISLEAWENCNLGHVNLDAFAPPELGMALDMPALMEAHALMTRFLLRATYGDVNDDKQAAQLARNRRIGVGHLGVQGFFAKMGIPYSQIAAQQGIAGLLDKLHAHVRETARAYAFELRIPEPVKTTCVAPTGTIAKLAGVSEGIHPIYARHFERRVRFSKRDDDQFSAVMNFMAQGFAVEDDIYDSSGQTAVVVFPTEDILVEQVRARGLPESVVQAADEISAYDMLKLQAFYQQHWADNAVSYTVNVPSGAVSQDELENLLRTFLPMLKGTTVMVDASRPQAPYTRITAEQYHAATAKTVEDSTDESCSSGACPVR